MCGIVGIFSPSGKPISVPLLGAMSEELRHRGPDDEGYVLIGTGDGVGEERRGDTTIPECRIPHIREIVTNAPALGLGWRRLAIVDLSPAGHQPMTTPDRSAWIVFNGEIYNHPELREELRGKGHRFRSRSDTEVILAAYKEWGRDCLSHFNGMWAFALWDNRERELFCSRDRFGVKPFYFTWDGTTFMFASEIKALLKGGDCRCKVNVRMASDYIRQRVIDHSDETFFENIHQLRPSHFLVLGREELTIRRYYQLPLNDEIGRFDAAEFRKLTHGYRERLRESISLRLRSDVPVGTCLSGGLDSSSIVCVANTLQADRTEGRMSFTATYDEPKFKEDAFVKLVVARTGVDAHWTTPTAERLWDELRAFVYAHDEPVISTSMFAQWCVMSLAHDHGLKVLLDGQGADEALAGYTRWHLPVYHAELLRAGRYAGALREIRAVSAVDGLSPWTHARRVAEKLIGGIMPATYVPMSRGLRSALMPEFLKTSGSPRAPGGQTLQRRLWHDFTAWNLPQLLHYEDRNSMAFSIEARVPFVDVGLVEYTMALPTVYKINGGWSKAILRHAMQGILPDEIAWRRDKMGFVTPQEIWLQELKPKMLSLLEDEEFRSHGLLKKEVLLRGIRGHSAPMESGDLWRLLNLELWMRTFNLSL